MKIELELLLYYGSMHEHVVGTDLNEVENKVGNY